MRHARLLTRLGFVAVVLLGLGVVADVVALRVAESRAGAGLAQATAAEKARVDLGSFPFLLGLFGGNLGRLSVEATGLSGAGLRVANLEVRVDKLAFSPSQAIGLIRSEHAKRARITVTNPYGRADITQQDLEEFLKARRPEVHDVRIGPAGIEVRFSVAPDAPPSPPARFLPRVENRKLVLTLIGVGNLPRQFVVPARAIEKSIDLPPIPDGMTVDVRLGDGVFVLEASGAQGVLLVGEGGITSA